MAVETTVLVIGIVAVEREQVDEVHGVDEAELVDCVIGPTSDELGEVDEEWLVVEEEWLVLDDEEWLVLDDEDWLVLEDKVLTEVVDPP